MWLGRQHKELFDRICDGSEVCSAEQLRERVCGDCGSGWTALVEAVAAVGRHSAAAMPVVERTFALLQMTRRLHAFVRVSADRLLEAHETLRSQCGMPGSGARHKRLRKEALRCSLWAEAVRATAHCCAELCGGSDSRATAAVMALECEQWRAAEQSASSLRLALFELRNGPLQRQLRQRPELVADCRSLSSFFADDVFLVPGHQVVALLVRLSAFVGEADAYQLTSVTLDTLPELEDYQQVCSGSGVAVTRMWWRGEAADALTLERHLLDEETGELQWPHGAPPGACLWTARGW